MQSKLSFPMALVLMLSYGANCAEGDPDPEPREELPHAVSITFSPSSIVSKGTRVTAQAVCSCDDDADPSIEDCAIAWTQCSPLTGGEPNAEGNTITASGMCNTPGKYVFEAECNGVKGTATLTVIGARFRGKNGNVISAISILKNGGEYVTVEIIPTGAQASLSVTGDANVSVTPSTGPGTVGVSVAQNNGRVKASYDGNELAALSVAVIDAGVSIIYSL